jgi:hypothetical protein
MGESLAAHRSEYDSLCLADSNVRRDFRLRDDVSGGRPRLATAIAASPPARVRSILIIECENGEARKPMLAHVVAGNMGKTYGQMIFGGLEDKGAPFVVCRQGIPE